ncbi:MAG: DUF5606 domain-containing protein [Bacteroidales bacterium]|jgi:hypothetical protein|nr:DUF5606 domain-containing protein [Bacteroidales bacterium]
MNLKEILAIPGKQGLYKLVSQGKQSIVVESLTDKTRIPVFVSMRASALDNICIYTNDEELPLRKVLKRISDFTGNTKISDLAKFDNAGLKKYMEEIIPEYDREKVHVSDMKKLFTWYNLLYEHNLLTFDEETEQENVPSIEN